MPNPDLGEQIFITRPAVPVPAFAPGERVGAARLNGLVDASRRQVNHVNRPRQYRRPKGGGGGGRLVELRVRGAVEDDVDAALLDAEYASPNEEISTLYAELECPFLCCARMMVPEDGSACDLVVDHESFLAVFMLPPMDPKYFKDPDGNQIYDAALFIDPDVPTFLAFRGARGLTLMKGHGEVWILPGQAPTENNYCS